MSDPFTIQPGTVTAKPSVASDGPAVVAPPVTVPDVDTVISQIKARLSGNKQAAAKPASVADPAKPDVAGKAIDNPPGDEPTEDGKTVPPKFLAELGRLQKQIRELEPKAKEFETIKTEADLAREVRKLWSGTPEEKLQAIAKISGKDGTDEMLALIKLHYTLEQEKPDDGSADVPPAVKDLSAKLDAAMKKIEQLESKDKSKETADAKKISDEETARANSHVKGWIEKNKAKFEICAREENQTEAIDLIQSAAIAILDRDKIDVKTMTQEQAEKAYQEAAEKTEAAFEATGKRMSKGAQPSKGADLSRFDRFVRTPSKPTIVVKDEPLSKNPDEAWSQLQQRLTAKLERGEFARGR